jgi:glycosyltransferase involved in cell wall biosynthesis
MLVSIIIPSFQQASFLRKALRSIEQQTFKDYEVLVVDGLSKDNTSEVVAEFKHLPIVFRSEPDKGIYDAMNKGVDLSSGTYLYFMGCDDSLASDDTLESIFKKKSVLRHDVIYGDVRFTETGIIYDGQFSILKLMMANICHQAVFVKKSVFDKIGKFNLRYKTYADWEFNMRWFCVPSITKIYIPLIIANYSVNGFSSLAKDDNFFSDKPSLERQYFSRTLVYIANNSAKPGYWQAVKFLSKNHHPFVENIFTILTKILP